jgi:glucan phosphoethanolaminetransferase (alkaline phosphatase superfamily)
VSISVPQVQIDGVPERLEASTNRPHARSFWSRLGYPFFSCSIRLAFASFLLLTSAYCLLVFVPFTYVGFVHNPLLNWIPLFVGFHGLLYGVLLGLVAITLHSDLRRKETRRASIAFLSVNGIVFFCLSRGSLARVQPNSESYLWSMLSLLPLVWLAILDLRSCHGGGLPATVQSPVLVRTTLAAVAVAIAFGSTAALRHVMRGDGSSTILFVGDLEASLCFHLVIFTVIGALLTLLECAARASRKPRLFQYVLTRVFAWVLVVQVLRKMVLPTISFAGMRADILSAMVAFALVLFVSGAAARLRAGRTNQRSPDAEAKMRARLWPFVVFALFAFAYEIPAMLGPTDWDFVLQRMSVLMVWLIVFQIVDFVGARMRGKAVWAGLSLVVVLAAAGFVRYGRLALYTREPSRTVRHALEDYCGLDISFNTAYDVLSHPIENKAYQHFYQFLRQNSNLGRDTVVAPVDIHLVSQLQPVPGIKPNIFFFVIDSLRRDYVSSYNSSVDFTPQIARFAQDSVVLKNAYTRYGGTALSEPAIWTGTMQLHKQYIEPFDPMNSLAKLLQVDGYHSFITVDPILKIILPPSLAVTQLDEGTFWEDLDFVATLHELESKIDARSGRDKPIFAYTQPQNVHTLHLQRSNIRGDYKRAIVFEIRRIDTAFGEFIEFLKQRGLYDNSIIILTADHGDSYGEFGRYGHSNFLFPEIIRIPLIIHLPPRMRNQFAWDANEIAFTTDITSSLYYLLGHGPILNNELFGRPLFTQNLQEQQAYLRPRYLIASSYAPVYAILGGHGESLFIADAVNSRSYYYDLSNDPLGSRNDVTIRLENENAPLIRSEIERIDDFYHWRPPQNAP